MFALEIDALLLLLAGGAIGLMLGGGFVAVLTRQVRHPEPLPTTSRTPAAAEAATRVVMPATRTPPAPALPQAADLLVVDDSAVARAKLRKLFEPAGYNVHLARDGVEALALMEKGRYALMITDLEMPNMDGVELINHCLQQPQIKGMPILAISGHENLRAKFNECRDVCGVHRKPWVDDILLSHVATLVKRPVVSREQVAA